VWPVPLSFYAPPHRECVRGDEAGEWSEHAWSLSPSLRRSATCMLSGRDAVDGNGRASVANARLASLRPSSVSGSEYGRLVTSQISANSSMRANLSEQSPKISVLDLFAGAGGLSAGFHAGSSKFDVKRAIEMDPAAAASFTTTFGRGLVYQGTIESWLREEEVPSVDVIIGGPPCQGFSTLGKQDISDNRNSLWQEYAATILRAQPKYFVVENVAAFARSQQFRDFEAATRRDGILRDYTFEWDVLNAADFGAFQARKRAILIGRHRDLPALGLPAPTHVGRHKTVAQAFATIPHEVSETRLPDRYQEHFGTVMQGAFAPFELHVGRDYSQLSKERFAAIPAGGNRFNLPDNLLAPCWRNHKTGSGDVMGRMHWAKPSVTIRTEFYKPEKGRYLHPFADRAITHYEAAVLQGFPDTHRFVGSKSSVARQIGNAVPIPLGKAIAAHLAMALAG
jgi:DNA (cytosine-5)-methyltransferase 1